MWTDNETKDDLLGYQVHADLLRDVVLDATMLPITIGVFGDWGSGKSSLMILMQESIEKYKKFLKEKGLRFVNLKTRRLEKPVHFIDKDYNFVTDIYFFL